MANATATNIKAATDSSNMLIKILIYFPRIHLLIPFIRKSGTKTGATKSPTTKHIVAICPNKIIYSPANKIGIITILNKTVKISVLNKLTRYTRSTF